MFKSAEHAIKSNQVDIAGSSQRPWHLWGNMRVKAFRLMPTTERSPAAAIAGTLTVLLMVFTIVVAVHEMLSK